MTGMGPGFTIGPVRSADDLLATRQLFDAYVASLGVDLGFQDFAGELAGLPGAYTAPGGALLLARRPDGEPLGCVALRPLPAVGHCEMKRLFVAPGGRGSGLGSALIEAVVAAAVELGYAEMRLDTLPDMHAALALYRRAGFAPVASYYASPLSDALYLGLALGRRTVDDRVTIHDFTDALAGHFHAINAEWIGAMYTLEPTDVEVLENPRATIIDRGGAILFAALAGVGIVGTCALQNAGGRRYELTKMGVLANARGQKVGEILLEAVIARARSLGADPLYLLSNRKSAAAIHLYEKLGFVHDAVIMAESGTRYQRCDVAMRFVGPG